MTVESHYDTHLSGRDRVKTGLRKIEWINEHLTALGIPAADKIGFGIDDIYKGLKEMEKAFNGQIDVYVKGAEANSQAVLQAALAGIHISQAKK